MRSLYLVSLLLLTLGVAAAAQAKSPMALFPGTELEWKDGPSSLPKGAKLAILEGDPTQPGTFTMRLRFPDGFQVFPHWHTQTEHPAGTKHFAWAEGETILQLHGQGPWTITYVNAADDPRTPHP